MSTFWKRAVPGVNHGQCMVPNRSTTRVFLALGANLGSPLATLREVVKRLEDVGAIVEISSVYRTAPVGYADQPDFMNLVCALDSEMGPAELIAATSALEHDLGREREIPNGPRTIDIDVLSFGSQVIDTPRLVVPHPRMHQRAFVLVPLCEIAPEWHHPLLARSAEDLLHSILPVHGIVAVGPLFEEGAAGR